MSHKSLSLSRTVRRYLNEDQRRWVNKQRRRAEAPLVSLRASRHSDLDALARRYGTDKSSLGHGYTTFYARHFKARRSAARMVLEIGVGGVTSGRGYETTAGGQSLRMWRDYFPKAIIVGIDIHPKTVSDDRIIFEQGDQSDQAFLAKLVSRYAPFDVVIDDGSHVGRDVNASFDGLWDAVNPGGFYVIEDLAVAYHPGWEGGPPGTSGTAVDLIKKRVDHTVKRYEECSRPPTSAMHVYAEIVFFEKALEG